MCSTDLADTVWGDRGATKPFRRPITKRRPKGRSQQITVTHPSVRQCPLSIVVRFSPTALTAEKYDKTIRTLEEAGDFPPAGLDYHVCFGSEGNLLVSEIWDSQEQFEAFGVRLMPILTEAGIEFSGPPAIFEVRNIIRR